MNRTQWTLTALLAAQLAVLLLVAWPGSGEAGEGASRPLIPELASFTPARIEIEEAKDRSVAIARGGEGWVLEGREGYPAAGDKVEKLLEDLKGVKVRRPVVSGGRYHRALKVTAEEHERRVRIWENESGDPRVDLLVGTSPNYRVSHVRLEGDDRVFEARGISPYDLAADAGSWIERQFVNVPAEEVTRIRVRNAHGEFELEKGDEGWKVLQPAAKAASELDGSAVDSVVRGLASLWLADPAGPVTDPAYGLADPAATVDLTYRAAKEGESAEGGGTPASETLTLRIGAEVAGGEGKRYASRSGFDHAVTLSSFDAEKATAKKLEELLRKS